MVLGTIGAQPAPKPTPYRAAVLRESSRFAAARTAGFLAATVGDMEFLPICFEISPCGLLDLEHPITVPLRCLDLADSLPMRFLPVSRDVRNAVEADIFGARAIAPIEERVPKRLVEMVVARTGMCTVD